MNRLVCLGLLSLTACGGPASVRVPPAPSITPEPCPACKFVQMPPSPTHRKKHLLWILGTPAICKWHTPGEHKPRTFHEHDLIEVLVRENSRSERTAELNTQRRADLNAGINQWPNFRAALE